MAGVGVGGSWAGVGDEVAASGGPAGGAGDAAVGGWEGAAAAVVATAVVAAGGGEVDDLADLEGGGVDARVGGLEGVDGDAEFLGDGPEGVAGLDGVGHGLIKSFFGKRRYEFLVKVYLNASG